MEEKNRMKQRARKILGLLLVAIMLLTMLPMSSFAAADTAKSVALATQSLAASNPPLSIDIATSKNSYTLLSTITFTVTVTNTGSAAVSNVSVEALFGNDLTPLANGSQITAEKASLAPGESLKFSYNAELTTLRQLDVLLLPLQFIFSLFKGASLPIADNGFNNGREYAQASKSAKLLSLFNSAYDASTTVKAYYGEIVNPTDFTLTIKQDDFTTTEVDTRIEGLFTSPVGIESILYTSLAESDEGTPSTAGEAIISGNDWYFDLRLKPGENVVTVTITDVNGQTKTASIKVTYDMGTISPPGGDDIVVGPGGIKYYKGVLLIFFMPTTSDTDARALIASKGGTVIGADNLVNLYEAKFNIEDYNTLAALADEFTALPSVIVAMLDELIEGTEAVAPNDPWDSGTTTSTGGAPSSWTNNTVNGSNWGLKAIEAPAAWDNNARLALAPTRAGVVDTGLRLSHTEFSNTTDNIDVFLVNGDGHNEFARDHGTHVAGTIMASPNNSAGITGIAWHGNLLFQSADASGALDGGLLSTGLTRTVANGAKVINYSIGGGGATGVTMAAATMASLLGQGFDFVVVQSAGNDSTAAVPVQASTNGWFCGIANTPTYAAIASANGISVQDMIDRIVVVASVDNDYNATSGYRLSSFSNVGNRVDIAAPGRDIYSTTSANNNSYGYKSGTSMAAPHVTGVASLVWSVNHGFSGAKIKEILCSANATTGAYNHGPADTRISYPMLNAKLAVERAVAIADAPGTATGRFVDATNGNPISGTYLIYKDNGTLDPYSGTTYTFNSSGTFSVTLPAGKYVLRASASGYVTKDVRITVSPSETLSYGDFPLSPVIGDDQIRIVLSWGEFPSDLDSHIIVSAQ